MDSIPPHCAAVGLDKGRIPAEQKLLAGIAVLMDQHLERNMACAAQMRGM